MSDTPATAAAVFTINKAQAAPVVVSREHLSRSGGTVRAVVVNSGCANACTGDEGMNAAREMAAETARLVGCPVEQVLVASTGVIGVGLPMAKIKAALPQAFSTLGNDQGPQAARAIMTTDPFPKEAATQLTAGGREVTIGGMAKGSGMIEPMLATMLAFVTTDAAVPVPLLQRALTEAVHDTFNAITVDGECSTNDTVMLLANGQSGATIGEADYAAFARWSAGRLPRACARHRPRRRRRHQAGHGNGQRRRIRRRREAHGEGDREFPAREDGHSRRRPELGAARLPWRAGPASLSI